MGKVSNAGSSNDLSIRSTVRASVLWFIGYGTKIRWSVLESSGMFKGMVPRDRQIAIEILSNHCDNCFLERLAHTKAG